MRHVEVTSNYGLLFMSPLQQHNALVLGPRVSSDSENRGLPVNHPHLFKHPPGLVGDVSLPTPSLNTYWAVQGLRGCEGEHVSKAAGELCTTPDT